MDPAYDEDPDLYFAESSRPGDSLASQFLASSAGELDGFYDGEQVSQDGGFSLAQELAGALMGEPTLDGMALADEIGFEFSAGAEEPEDGAPAGDDPEFHERDTSPSHRSSMPPHSIPPSTPRAAASRSRGALQYSPLVTDVSQDYLETLSKNLQSVDAFLSKLETMDSEPAIDGLARKSTVEDSLTDLLRKLRKVASERESQVKGLEQIGRDLKQRPDIQLHMQQIELVDGWMEESLTRSVGNRPEGPEAWRPSSNLSQILESPDEASPVDRDEDEEDVFSSSPRTPAASSREPKGPAFKLLASLEELRTTNDSLIRSLSSISEQAQVNAAANADAGRRLRALRNRVAAARDEWESAERSRLWIEQWERGEWPDDLDNVPALSSASSSADDSPSRSPGTPSRSVKAKDIVDAQLKGFILTAKGASDVADALRSVCGLHPGP